MVKYELSIGNNCFIFEDSREAYSIMKLLALNNHNDILIRLEPYNVPEINYEKQLMQAFREGVEE